LDRPELYMYIYHGGNVSSRGHYQNLIRRATQLSLVQSASWFEKLLGPSFR
jgi:hypothetical protein